VDGDAPNTQRGFGVEKPSFAVKNKPSSRCPDTQMKVTSTTIIRPPLGQQRTKFRTSAAARLQVCNHPKLLAQGLLIRE